MWKYEALLVLHVLFVITWLGPDFVSWYVAWLARVPRFELPVRLQVVEILRVIDQFSRMSTILLIPTGIGLLRVSGWGLQSVPVALLWLAAAVCFIWAAANFWFTALQKSFHGLKPFFIADQLLRLSVAVAALVLIGTSIGSGGIDQAWLFVKVAIFAAIMLSAIVAFMLPNPFLILGEIIEGGSTEDRESRFTSSLDKIMTIVVGINTSLVVLVIVAVTKL
ncbi:MAG: hypothetical protein ACR2OD_03035 [Gaiellaceae bacterium]